MNETIVVKARDQDSAPLPASLAKTIQYLQAIDIGHPVVENNAVGILCVRIRKQGASARVAADRIAARSQQQLKTAPNAWIVVGDEDRVAGIAFGTFR